MILAATGHRPRSLLGYSDEAFAEYCRVAEIALVDSMPDVVISGMAQGWDTAIATAALKLGMDLHAYVAFEGVDRKWHPRDRRRFRALLDAATKVKLVNPGKYVAWKLHARNVAMVDACDRVAALWNGREGGGTWNCVGYAQKTGKPVTNYWEELKKP